MGWGEPNGQRDPLLTGVKLKVEKGQRVLVLGPNGAGKTTLLKVISGQVTWLCSHTFTFVFDDTMSSLLVGRLLCMLLGSRLVGCGVGHLHCCPHRGSVSRAPLVHP